MSYLKHLLFCLLFVGIVSACGSSPDPDPLPIPDLLINTNDGLYVKAITGTTSKLIPNTELRSWSDIKQLRNNTLLARSGGSIWRSEDNGKTWLESTGLQNVNVSSDYVELADGSLLATYSGSTGGMPSYGGGLLMSADNGKSWTKTMMTGSYSSPQVLSNGVIIFTETVTTTTPSYTSSSKIWRSTDNGKTWDSNAEFTNTTFSNRFSMPNGFVALSYYETVSTTTTTTFNRGILVSQDSGETWAKTYTETVASMMYGSPSFNFNNLNDGTIFATLTEPTTTTAGLMLTKTKIIKSEDNGKTWTTVSHTGADVLDRFVILADNAILSVGYNNPTGTTTTGVKRIVFKSIDKGVTWAPTTAECVESTMAVNQSTSCSLEVSKINGLPYVSKTITKTTYSSSTMTTTTYEGEIRKSLDQGTNWDSDEEMNRSIYDLILVRTK